MSKDFKDLIQKAVQLFKEEKWDELISVLTELLNLTSDPKIKAFLYNWRGLLYDRKDEYDKAIADFDKAIELDPEDAHAYDSRGSLYARKGEYDKAIVDFRVALKLAPSLKSTNPFIYIISELANLFKGDKASDTEPVKIYFSLFSAVSEIKNRRFSKPKNNKVAEVAHYTSLHVLKNLADKQPFRLYNAAYMNDPEEGRVFFEIMEEYGGGKIAAEFYEDDNPQSHPSNAYIGSFVTVEPTPTPTPKKDKLFLWRLYGKHAKEEAAGACLLFRHNNTNTQFAEMIPFRIGSMQSSPAQKPTNPPLYEIVYENECAKELSKELKKLGKSLQKLKRFYGTCAKNETTQKALAKLCRELLDEIRFLFKADHYKEEKEVRVVQMHYEKDDQSASDIEVDTEQIKDNQSASDIEADTEQIKDNQSASDIEADTEQIKDNQSASDIEADTEQIKDNQSTSDIEVDTEQIPPRFYLKTPENFRFNEVILGPQAEHFLEWRQWLNQCNEGLTIEKSEISHGKKYS